MLLQGTCSYPDAAQDMVREHHYDPQKAMRLLSVLQIPLKRKVLHPSSAMPLL